MNPETLSVLLVVTETAVWFRLVNGSAAHAPSEASVISEPAISAVSLKLVILVIVAFPFFNFL